MTEAQPAAATNPLSRLARRAPISVFLIGTFVWAWALWGYWIPAMPSTGLVITPAFILCAIVGGFAPSLAAFATAWLIGGGASAGHLLHGITHWRAAPYQYVLALGIVPAATILTTVLLPVFVGPLRPADPSIMAMAAIWPVMAALGEEFGWRGFMFPHLLRRYGPMGAAVLVGLVWGLWHLPADYIGLKGFGSLFWLAFVINGPFVLTAHALIMAWLWRKSGSNLVMMILYHWTITASAMLAPTAGGQDALGLASAALGAAVFWVIAIGLWLSEVKRR
ncbi:MAG: CPBP family intramembrane metalloprotease [Devosia sp.]|nr:CPBP family intramembrane metalloprotease [Devosia sp.]